MPHFFFHVTDGRRVYRDPTGCDLPSVEAARRHALDDARVLLENWMTRSRSAWRIEVADDAGRTVLTLSVAEAAVSEAVPLFHEPEELAA